MPSQAIATLWLQLTEIYGARFVNQYGEKDSGVWYQALSDLTEDSITHGLNTMLRDERFETWPPNCTQFRKLCLSGLKSCHLPNVHRAFYEARQNVMLKSPVWSHPAVKFTVKHIGVEIVNAGRTDFAFAKFSTAYAKVCERIKEGHLVPDVSNEEVTVSSKKQFKQKPVLKAIALGRIGIQ